MASVAIYSELDRDAPHVRRAGEAYNLGEGPAADNYLSIEKILDAAGRAGAEAIHPGYGFLAENAPFAQACEDAGIVFIGPPASAIEAMGSKTQGPRADAGRGRADRAGHDRAGGDGGATRCGSRSEEIGFPVAVKAAGGGGGKGFRVALAEDELEGAFEGSSREGEKFFSDPTVYLERYLPRPAPRRGPGARGSARQRDPPRGARLLDPAPPPEGDRGVPGAGLGRRRGHARADRRDRGRTPRRRSTTSAPARSRGCSPPDGEGEGGGEYFFLEMNTRVQVEHCVTEMTTGIDIVKEGIRAAAGEPSSTPRTTSSCAATRSSAASTPRTRRRTSPRRRAGSASTASRAGPGVRVDSGRRAKAARSRRCTTRWSPS